MQNYWIIALVALMLSACAQNPKNIQALYVSELQYQAYSCEQLRETLLNVNTALGNAHYQQGVARGNDALGILVVGLPVASMTGRDQTSQVAYLKGHADAIQRSGEIKKCGSLAPIIKWD